MKQASIVYFAVSENQRRWSGCAVAQADLRLFFGRQQSQSFSRDEAQPQYVNWNKLPVSFLLAQALYIMNYNTRA